MSKLICSLIAITLFCSTFCHMESTSLNFLANTSDKSVNVFLADSEVTTSPSPSDIALFAKGFMAGFKFFDNLPHQQTCDVADKQVSQDILDIVDLIKNISIVDITTTFFKIMEK